ncbi:Asp-tRNA(Asn)/Glu-tRNA(Gln) amidotransferase subunit GatC [Desulfovibrio ferrophilus]|uniref:Aspartyl/glutamyl-tRNA(Asn/Gln) amidotransferase subunit C n=1 Tax=Desulfovibrio ferrophilus TaxID=241368 RepID=A0A2Z6AV89_9BACT|nr:Asp-tRNA(Asn)/Glu-tRNA(Gln) amidotransferase subunit GatC [Desulfovibrio ferrophilus]BBD07159.1 glutamyl-tRNA(Gln) amidotransferase subunit C [Desulfovibrio ferrophilus]
MSITRDDVTKIAKLARLDLPEEKLDTFAAQMGDILAYMDELSQVDTDGVEPLYTPVEHVTRMRTDEVRKDFEREDILGNAPQSDGSHFIVPKIV